MVYDGPLDPTKLQSVRYDREGFSGGYAGGCTDGEYIYLPPYTATHLVRVSRKTGVISNGSEFGEWPSELQPIVGQHMFCGCAFDGFRGVWLVPHRSTYLVRVDTISLQMTLYDNWPSEVTFKGTTRFCGAAISAERKQLWLHPMGASHPVGVVDIVGSTSAKATGPKPNTEVMVAGPDYPADMWTGSTAGEMPFAGGVLALDSIWFVPLNVPSVVEMPLDGSSPMKAHRSWPTGTARVTSAYSGGTFDGLNSVWFAPYHAKEVLKVDIRSGGMTAFAAFPSGTLPARAFSTAAFDGKRLWIANAAAGRMMALETATGVFSEYDQWPQGVSFFPSTDTFGGIIFDGCSLWLIPRAANLIVRWIDTGKTVLGQNGAGFSGWERSSNLADGLVDSAPPLSIAVPTPDYHYVAVRVSSHVWLFTSRAAHRVHMNTGAVTEIEISGSSSTELSQSGGYDGHGRIWLAPAGAAPNHLNVLAVNTTHPFSVDTFAIPTSDGLTGSGLFNGACINNLGQLVMGPKHASKLVTMSTTTAEFKFFDKWPSGITASMQTKFAGIACSHFDNAAYLAPSAADHLVKFDPLASAGSELSIIGPWPSEIKLAISSANMFAGATLDGTGTLWISPVQEMAFCSLDINNARGTSTLKGMDNWAQTGDTQVNNRLRGLCSDGHSIFGSPYNVEGARAINASAPTDKMKALNRWPSSVAQGTYGFGYPLFDGVSIWFPNYAHKSVLTTTTVRLVDRRKVLFNGNGISNGGLLSRAGTQPLPRETMTERFGPTIQSQAAVYDGARYMYIPPAYHQPAVKEGLVRVDVETGEKSQVISSWPGVPFSPFTHKIAFGGGIMVGAEHIFLVPGTTKTVVRVNLIGETITTVGGSAWPATLTDADTDFPFLGGAFDGTHVWMFPRTASDVLKVHHETLKLTKSPLPVFAGSAGKRKFGGGVYDGEKYFILIPEELTVVLRINRGNGLVKVLDEWPTGFIFADRNFVGGAFDGEWVWMAPAQATMIVKVHPEKAVMVGVGTVSVTLQAGSTGKFQGACTDGESIYFSPYSAQAMVRVDIKTGKQQHLSNWPSNYSFTEGASANKHRYSGCVFDGQSVWLTPLHNGELIRWRAAPSNTIIAQDGSSYSGPVVATPLPSPLEWEGKSHGQLTGGHFNAVFDAASRTLYVLPADKPAYDSGVVKLDVDSGNMTMLPLPAWPTPASTSVRSTGGTFVASASAIYLSPAADRIIVKFSTADPSGGSSIIDIPSDVIWEKHEHHFFAGSTYDGSHVWLAALSSSHIIKLDPQTDIISKAVVMGNHFGSNEKPYLCGVVFDGESSVYFTPIYASSVLQVNIHTDAVKQWYGWPTTNGFKKLGRQFCGGAIGGGKLWLPPLSGTVPPLIVSMQLGSGAMEAITLPASIVPGNNFFFSACFDGETVHFTPLTADGIVSINAKSGAAAVRKTFPWVAGDGGKTEEAGFRGAVFDGQSLWLVPRWRTGELVQFSSPTAAAYPPTVPIDQILNQDGNSFSPPLDSAPSPLSGTFFTVTYPHSGVHGLVTSPDGRWVFALPYDSSRLVRIDSFSGRMNSWSTAELSDSKHFCGGVYDDEGNIFLPPYTSMSVLRFNTSNEAFTSFTFPRRSYQYYCGAIATDETVLFIPAGKIGDVLRLDKNKKAKDSLDMVPLPNGLRTSKTTGNPPLFSGAVMADGGWLWFAPSNAAQLVKMSVRTYEIVLLPQLLPQELTFTDSTMKFIGGAFDGTHVWFTPHSASHVMRVHPSTVTMRLFAVFADNAPTFQYAPQMLNSMRFDTGTSLYMFVLERKNDAPILRIDISKPSPMFAYPGMSMFPETTIGRDDRFRGSGFDGRSIWLGTMKGTHIVRWVDTTKAVFAQDGYSSSGLTFINDTLEEGVLVPTLFKKHFTSNFSVSAGQFENHATASFDGNETIYMTPSHTNYVLAFNVVSGISRELRDWPAPTGEFFRGVPFLGSVYDNHRYVWLAPYDSLHVARIDVTPSGGEAIGRVPITWPSQVAPIGAQSFGGATCDSEHVWFAPRRASAVVRINIHDDSLSYYNGWPSLKSGFKKDAGFTGIAFDGVEAMWLCPGKANQVVRVPIDGGSMSGFGDWPSELVMRWGDDNAFVGCSYDAKRHAMWLSPHYASHLVRLNTESGNMKAIAVHIDPSKPPSSWPPTVYATRVLYTGGDALFIMAKSGDPSNNNGTSMTRFNIEADTIDRFYIPDSAALGIDAGTTWAACVYDGASLWQLPFRGHYIVRWDVNRSSDNVADPPTPTATRVPPVVRSRTKSSTASKSIPATPSNPPTSAAPDSSSAESTSAAPPTEAPATDVPISSPPTDNATSSPSPQPATTVPPTPEPPEETAEQTEEPRVSGRVVKVSTVLPGGEEANTAVMTTAGGSAVATSTFAGTATVSSVARVSAATRMLDCPLSEDDPRPSYFELPLQFAVGSGRMGYFAGASITAAALTAIIAAIATYLQRTQSGSPKALKVIGAFSAAHLMYFGPNALGASITVLAHAEEATARVVAVVAIALVVAVAAFYIPWMIFTQAPLHAATRRAPGDSRSSDSSAAEMKFEFVPKCGRSKDSDDDDDGSSSSDDSDDDDDPDEEGSSSTSTGSSSSTAAAASNPSSSSDQKQQQQWFLYHVEPWFDATRDFTRPATRMYSAMEFTSAAIAQMLAGVRPDNGCVNVAWGVLAVSTLMLAYLIVLRPYRTRLDMVFSIAVNATQVALTMCVLYSIKAEVTDADHPTVKFIEGALYVLVAIYYVQVFAQGYWAWHCTQRRRAALEASETKHAALLVMTSPPAGSGLDAMGAPLLQGSDDDADDDVEMENVTTTVSNPLHGGA